MKRLVVILLTLVVLIQALPVNALAAAGHVLTAEELAAAYALTGFGDSGVQRNAVFHKGMTPNESWNAMQVSDWLDEQLNTYMYSVEEILSRASVKLAQLKKNDREGYSRFSDENPKYEGMVDYIRGVYGSAETLRDDYTFDVWSDGKTIFLVAANAIKFDEDSYPAASGGGDNSNHCIHLLPLSYSYQWQVFNPKTGKWVDLKGFTEPTLNREAVEKKWDGARFRCVVTDADGTQIVSREVTLTVRDQVPTGDDTNLLLYLAVALIALALMLALRRRRRAA